ncbi:MAG: DUF3179 domain-containing (seleno)protein, partial [Chloroflexota bacterium]
KVAQGTLDETPFMMTFCVLCNHGGVFETRVEDDIAHFGCYGFHQGMAVLSDVETQSRWNHITGHCVYGEKKGYKLERIGDIRHTTVGELINTDPDTLISFPVFNTEETETANRWNNNYRSQHPAWSDGLLGTFAVRDERLPRFDMGVGVWTGNTARYYRVLTLNAQNNAIVDTIDGRNVVVYYDEETGFPSAFYTDATAAEWVPGIGMRLNNGTTYKNGVIRSGAQKITPERPRFQNIRWYGFSYLFPDCEIYGE